MTLPVTDIQRDHAGDAATQEHIGEAARRSANVERVAPADDHSELVERRRKFVAAPARVFARTPDYGYFRGARQATDEYFRDGAPSILLNRIDDTARIGVKSA